MTINSVALDREEQVLWSGKPNALWFAIRRGWQPLGFGILLLVVWTNFLFEPGLVATSPDPKVDHVVRTMRGAFLGGAIVVALLCFLAVVWLWLRAYRTTYLLTNRRVVIDTASPLPRRTSLPLEHLRFIEFRSKFFGPADLVFMETGRFSLEGWGLRGEGFIAIPEAAQVEILVRNSIEQTFATRTRRP